MVTCAACGAGFDAARKNAKYCSDRCRKRGQRGAEVVELPADAGVSADVGLVPRGSVELATYRELEQAGRLETTLGQTCLTLARRLDFPGVDTGSAVSSVAGRLDDLMAKALKGTKAATAPQQLGDELAARRQRRA